MHGFFEAPNLVVLFRKQFEGTFFPFYVEQCPGNNRQGKQQDAAAKCLFERDVLLLCFPFFLHIPAVNGLSVCLCRHFRLQNFSYRVVGSDVRLYVSSCRLVVFFLDAVVYQEICRFLCLVGCLGIVVHLFVEDAGRVLFAYCHIVRPHIEGIVYRAHVFRNALQNLEAGVRFFKLPVYGEHPHEFRYD